MQKVRHDLDATDRRITAVLLALERGTADPGGVRTPVAERRSRARTLLPLPEDEALIDALVEDSRMTYGELAHRTGRTPRAVRRRLDALVETHGVRLATEVDLALLGVHAEALLWITADPGALEETGQILSRHPQVRFTAATTGSSSLLVAVAATDLSALYVFLTGTVGALPHISGIEVAPILSGVKRTGLVRPASISV
ncbi:Lrp/AsnC family transcriptional regulator [Streptomyces sp. AgN23]|uniref:Lrp/AsnC family transcriptional regulator n=1 Tax=Streptomyces sp. AgN23 TaxID=1188315 RepID=UPI001FF0ECCA|nr:Lrp/AsnC family transcriptional regulator [Streptomyces sp. AgN23]